MMRVRKYRLTLFEYEDASPAEGIADTISRVGDDIWNNANTLVNLAYHALAGHYPGGNMQIVAGSEVPSGTNSMPIRPAKSYATAPAGGAGGYRGGIRPGIDMEGKSIVSRRIMQDEPNPSNDPFLNNCPQCGHVFVEPEDQPTFRYGGRGFGRWAEWKSTAKPGGYT
jgi:hypothetical protein